MNRRSFLSSCFQAAAAQGLAPQIQGPAGEAIERARQSALDALKPTPAQLEHGLALHAQSTVIDAYGFAPQAAIDGAAFQQAMEAGASALELQDLHEEMMMTRPATDAAERAEFFNALRASGVTAVFQNAGEEGQAPGRLLKRLARFTHTADRLRPLLIRAAHPSDIAAAKSQGHHCLYFSGNGVPLAGDWNTAQEELGFVRVFFQLGIRMMHVTYNRRNMLGDGCAEPSNAGLSDLGRAAIAEMNRVGVIVDVAHSGWRTSLEAARASSKPITASHTVCAAAHHHIRGKPDDVIKAIAGTGGYIGICCIPAFLGRDRGIGALLDHIDYAVKLAGADHVAIGTDTSHVSSRARSELAKLPKRQKSRPRFEALWPPDAFAGAPDRHPTLAWTNWPLFTVGLVQRGHSDADIQKILGGNVLRVAAAVLPAWA